MKKKNKFKIIILYFVVILTTSYTSIFSFNFFEKNNEKNEFSSEKLENSDYSSFSDGSGEDINVSLHQSLLDDSVIEISNVSDSNNNTFYEPCPTVENFNNSLVNMTVEDIYAPNKNWEIETTIGTMRAIYIYDTALGFQVIGNCILNNFSICFTEDFSGGADSDADIFIQIRNAEWDNGQIEPGPIILNSTYDIVLNGTDAVWHNYTDLNINLNVTQTYNNYFFIWMTQVTSPGDARVRIHERNDGPVNDAILMWDEVPWIEYATDPCLKVGLAPFNSYPDKNLVVQDAPWSEGQEFLSTSIEVGSFKVAGSSCYILKNVSIAYDTLLLPNNATVYVHLYNSTWNGTASLPGIELNNGILLGNFEAIEDSLEWEGISGLNFILNNSYTENNTWFIGLKKLGSGTPQWRYQQDDSVAPGANGDNSYVYYYDAFALPSTKWKVRDPIFETTRDYFLKVGLSPLENIPKPTDIGLKINNTAVIGDNYIPGFGYWNSTQNYSSSSGQLEFVISADWWDVSCKISRVQINYTKTDLIASSMFRILGTGQDVQWNVSRTDGLNIFDPRLSNYGINFTITSTWNNINVFNGPIDKTGNVLISPKINGHKTIQVTNAGNGTYWHLTATSENLFAFIDTYVDLIATDTVKYSDIVDFNATFKDIIAQNDGIINLSVYNPSTVDNKLIFTCFNSTFDSGIEYYLGSWDVSDTITGYGNFRIQVIWSNSTAAGFSEKILTIIGETDLSLITPGQYAPFYTNQSFDIIVYYEDSDLLTPIDGATIEYNIDGQGLQSTTVNNGTIGYYVISVDCSTFTTEGTKAVDINANKQYHNSQPLTYYFNIIVVEEPSKPSKPGIPGYNLFGLIGLYFVMTIIIIKKKYKN
jgi:hypothetical protein